MKSITVGQLRQNPTRALDEVQEGQIYAITRHQRVIAHLVPAHLVPFEPISHRKNPGNPSLSTRTPRDPRETDALLAAMEEDR